MEMGILSCRTIVEYLEGNEEGLALNLDLFNERKE